MLDLTALSKAYKQLENSLAYCNSGLAQNDLELFNLLRAGAIQAFEFTYELSIKMIRRQLIEFETAANIESLAYKDLIRTAARKSLLDDPNAWFIFRDMRNIISHIYEQSKAKEIYQQLPAFAKQVKLLLTNLENLNKV